MLDRSVVIGIGLMIALLGVGAITSYRSIQSMRRTANWVAHTHDVDRKAIELTRTLADVVVNLRGHLIQGDESSRVATSDSLARAEREFRELKEQTVDNPQQQGRLQSLHKSMDSLTKLVLAQIERRSRETSDLARQDSQLDAALLETRKALGEFRATESRLLTEREEEVGAAFQTTLLGSVVLFCMGLILFTGIVELVRRNATAQDLQQARLVAEREQLNVTLASIEDAVVTVDRKGLVTQWNLAAERLTGVSSALAVGQNSLDVLRLWDELTGQPVPVPVNEVLENGTPVSTESVCVTGPADQRQTPVAIRISPVRRPDGSVDGALVAIREVNELRLAEIARTERARVLAIRADIGLIVSHKGQTVQLLHACAKAICEGLAAAAVSIWKSSRETNLLVRAAGECSRDWEFVPCPMTDERQGYLLDVVDDNSIRRTVIPAAQCELAWTGLGPRPPLYLWALPLTIENQPIGLLAVYTLKSLTDLTSSELSLVGAKLSQFISRRQVEEERQASEEMFRTLANSIPQLAWMARPDGHIFWYNQRWFDYTGTTLDDMQGWGWQAVHDPDELPHVLSSIRHSFATGDAWEDTFPLRRHDGEFRWHLSRMVPVKDEQGRIRLWFGTNTDVTEQRNAEQRLRRVTDAMFSFVGILAPDGTLIETNKAQLLAANLSRNDVIGLSFWDCYWWNYSEEVRSRLRAAFFRAARGEWIRYDEEMRVNEDQRITIDIQLQPVFDGNQLLFVISSGVDVTARRRAEEATKRWSEQHRLLAEIAVQLSGSRGPAEILDYVARGARALINSQVSETLQWGADGTIERSATDSSPGAGLPAKALLEKTAWINDRVRESNRPFSSVPKVPNQASEQGVTDDVCCLAVPLTNQRGLCTGVIRICGTRNSEYTADDEAILVQLAQMASVSVERSRLFEEIRLADERKDHFLAMLAHELRNPLSAISTAVQLLQQTSDDPEQVRSVSDLAWRQCHHLKRLVDDLLDISRISRGKLTIQKTVVCLQDIARHAIETSQPVIESGRHTLTATISEAPISVHGDSVRLAQAISNLLVNAAKYTPPGGQISITLALCGDLAEIEIRDNGIGIPADKMDQIFEVFAQVDTAHARTQGGLGIGLSLARTLVLMHGGTIEGHSDGENRGSRFTIRLPVVDAPGQSPDAADSKSDNTPTRSRRILVVDDNRAAVHLLGRLLTTMGHQVETANDGQSALSALGRFEPELVISDIGMPDMNGYELARRIHEQNETRVPVLVALTGYGQADDREAAKAAGFNFHLTKPVSVADLQKLMRELPSEQ